MIKQKRHPGQAFLNFSLFALLFLCYGAGIFDLEKYHAVPMLILPFLISFSMFSDEMPAAFTGLVAGIFLDSMSTAAYCFHTLFFCLVALAVSLSVRFLLNNNLKTALLLSILGTAFYYLLRWLLFRAFHMPLSDSVLLLLRYFLPSLIYTAPLIVPFYFLHRALARRRAE